MFSRRLLPTILVSVLFSSPVFSGGGKNATISLLNATNGTIMVFIDPHAPVLTKLPANPTKAQIEQAGGMLVNTGATVKVKVQAGDYLLVARNVPQETVVAQGDAPGLPVTIGRYETRRFAFNGESIIPLQ